MPSLLLFFLAFSPRWARAAQSAALGDENGRQFLLGDLDLEQLSPDSLTRDQALDDFAYFQKIVRQAYGGYGYFQEKGAHWNKLFNADSSRIRARKKWGTIAYFGLLMGFFKKARILDGHLSLNARSTTFELSGAPGRSIWWPRFSNYYVHLVQGKFFLVARSAASASIPEALVTVDGRLPGQFLFRTYVPGRSGKWFLLGFFGDRIKEYLACTVAGRKTPLNLPLHAGRMYEFQPHGPLFQFKKVDGVPVVALRTLREAHAGDLERFLATAKELRRAPVIILDLRGNNGGRDGWGSRWLGQLRQAPTHVPMSQDGISSPAAMAGEANWIKAQLHNGSYDDAGDESALESSLAAALARLKDAETAHGKEDRKFASVDIPGRAPRPSKGKLLVLSDRRNASAGESFLEMAKAVPGTVIMGENSEGVMAFGNIGLYQLPHSRIRVSLGTSISRWNGKVLEGPGVLPDVWMDEPDILPAAVSYAKALIKRRESSPAPGSR